jgi:hypothetical protein
MCRCDEWLCQRFLCSYRYTGLANPDEVAFSCSIALQAYFEGRKITPQDMEKCLDFWQTYISEQGNPLLIKRPVCCEPYIVPCYSGGRLYEWTHPERTNPYPEEETTDELKEVSFCWCGVPYEKLFNSVAHHFSICRLFADIRAL